MPKRAQIISLLCEGNSLRAASRLADVSINTITKLLIDAGMACSEYQNRVLVNLPCKRVQIDEAWAFVRCKEKNVPEGKKGQLGYGDIWTWVALCADTKLVPSWWVGHRDGENARALLADLASRMAGRIQLTSDGFRAYPEAVRDTFLDEVDFAQLVKIYGELQESEKRYSPAECIGCERDPVSGKPDPKHISTSFVERQNLTLRMHIRRFTRLTNAFSKKAENHIHAVALHFMFYNFCRIHKTLRVTPAMAAGVTDRLWSVDYIVRVIEEYEAAEAAPAQVENADLGRLRNEANTFTPARLRRVKSNLEDDGFSN